MTKLYLKSEQVKEINRNQNSTFLAQKTIVKYMHSVLTVIDVIK